MIDIYRRGVNFVFIDHKAKDVIEEKLLFYRSIFRANKFALIYNTASDIQLCDELSDVLVIRLPDSFPLRGYTAASLWATCQIPMIAARDDFRDSPTVPIECDLEIAKADYEARVFKVLSAPSANPYGASCWTAIPPTPDLFHGGDGRIIDLFNKAFHKPVPTLASTLGSFVFTAAGADAFIYMMDQPEVKEYYSYLVELAQHIDSGRHNVIYATHYFTDYSFILACQMAELDFAECVNKVNPKIPTLNTVQSGAGQTNTPVSKEEFDWMIDDDRYYVIHHLDTNGERFHGAKECVYKLRERLKERSHSRMGDNHA